MLKKNKKYLKLLFCIFLLGIFMIPFTEGVVVKQWEEVEISHPIRLDGSPNPSILANITIKDPNNDIVVSTSPMTYNPDIQEHNYTLVSSFTGELGVYSYSITASAEGQNQTDTFEFEVTPSGDSGLTGYFFLIIILSYGLLAFGFWKEDITISILGTFALYFVGLYIMFNGIDIFKNTLTDGFSLITLGIAGYTSFRMAHEYINV